jgi:alpha-N-arabinofuranosidase
VPLLDATAVLDEESGTMALFAVNRDQHQPMALEVDLRSLPGLDAGEPAAVSTRTPTPPTAP